MSNDSVTNFPNGVAMGADITAATSGSVTIPVTSLMSVYNTNSTADIAATLADGVEGQMKIIQLKDDGGSDLVVTPENLTGQTTLTFDAAGETAILVFVDGSWSIVYNTSTAST